MPIILTGVGDSSAEARDEAILASIAAQYKKRIRIGQRKNAISNIQNLKSVNNSWIKSRKYNAPNKLIRT